MNIQKLWPTPILVDRCPLPEPCMEKLKELVVWREGIRKENPVKHPLPVLEGMSLRPSYNLFTESIPEQYTGYLALFKSYVKTCYLSYLQESYKVGGLEDAKIVTRCFGSVLLPGQRTKPHYHHTCDHVFVLYLDCGYNRQEKYSLENHRGDGELLMMDPRFFSSFPFWEKTHLIETTPGLMVLHPASVWHETNVMSAEGKRAVIVVTFRFESHNYKDLYCPL